MLRAVCGRRPGLYFLLSCDDEQWYISEALETSSLERCFLEPGQLIFVHVDIRRPAVDIETWVRAMSQQALPPRPHSQPVLPQRALIVPRVLLPRGPKAGQFVDLPRRARFDQRDAGDLAWILARVLTNIEPARRLARIHERPLHARLI